MLTSLFLFFGSLAIGVPVAFALGAIAVGYLLITGDASLSIIATVMFGGMDAQGGPMLHQVRQLGIDAIFVTGDGGCSREFLRLAGDDSDDALYCTMSGVPLDAMPGGPDFRDRFEARFGDPVQLYSPYAYDAAMALVHAIRRAGSSDPVRFLPVLRSNVFQGVTGNIAFDASGDVKEGAITVYRHENGRWVAQ